MGCQLALKSKSSVAVRTWLTQGQGQKSLDSLDASISSPHQSIQNGLMEHRCTAVSFESV